MSRRAIKSTEDNKLVDPKVSWVSFTVMEYH